MAGFLRAPDASRQTLRSQIHAWLESGLRFIDTDNPNGAPLLQTAAQGRPHSAVQLHGQTVGISLSYARGLAVAVVSRHAEIGVDVLYLPEIADWDADEFIRLARLYGSPTWQAIQQSAPATQQAPIFAHHWTRFEAELKAVGQPMRENTAAFGTHSGIIFHDLVGLPEGYVGAVAIHPNRA